MTFVRDFIFEILFAYVIMCVTYLTDFVFGPICSTRKVYEEGARDVALSALSGINGKELDFHF